MALGFGRARPAGGGSSRDSRGMGPLPPYAAGDQPDEGGLSTSKKLVLLVVALVLFHLIALVSESTGPRKSLSSSNQMLPPFIYTTILYIFSAVISFTKLKQSFFFLHWPRFMASQGSIGTLEIQ